MTTTQPRPNVLITSAGRKVLLVQAFQAALARCGGGRLVAVDVAADSAALLEADAGYLVPAADDPAYLPTLEAICQQADIGLLVPTRDEDLPVLATARDRFRSLGTSVLVSSPAAIAACQDKLAFASAVERAGVEVPRHRDRSEVVLPAFVKPRVGKGGRGAIAVHTTDELAGAISAIELAGGEPLVQELVAGQEYTVDVFIATDSRAISAVPRERLLVVGGESVIGRTVRDDGLVAASLALCAAIGLTGHLTVQAIRSADRLVFIEINPRYGGAADLGFAAGAPTPEFAVREARGERLESRLGDYEVGLVMLRYSVDRFVRDGDARPEPFA